MKSSVWFSCSRLFDMLTLLLTYAPWPAEHPKPPTWRLGHMEGLLEWSANIDRHFKCNP